MTLAALIARLGLAEVARRAGVKPSTVERWIRTGPSARGRDVLAAVIRRHLASRKGIETRAKRKKFAEGLSVPPESYADIGRPRSGFLDEDDLMPGKSPVETGLEFGRARKRAGYTGEHILSTDRYYGESEWHKVSSPMLDVNVRELAEDIAARWKISGRTFARVKFLAFRYIPYNPLYEGQVHPVFGDMEKSQGKWVDFWTSTRAWGSEDSIANAVEVALGPMVQAAYSRVIWLEAYNLENFDYREDLPTHRPTRRRR